MVSVLGGRGSGEGPGYSPLQTLVILEVSTELSEGTPGEKYKWEDSGNRELGAGPRDNLLLAPLTAVHVVT